MTMDHDAEHHYLIGLARAAGGAIIFGLPLFMTMEVWTLGVSIGSWRLLLLTVMLFPALVALSHFSGFESTFELKEDVLDALAAFVVAFLISAVALLLLGVLKPDASLVDGISKVLLQTLPASVGALLAQSQFGGKAGNGAGDDEQDTEGPRSYFGELFVMAVGAVFLAFNVAPTEEVQLIADKMSGWHALALTGCALATMHAFVYAVEFHGQAESPEHFSRGGVFLRFTVAGYGIALLISAYILWTFGRFDGLAPYPIVASTVVLGFPSAIGAAASRLIL